MLRLRIAELTPGMKLAENVYSFDHNQLIMSKGTVLDDASITKLAFYSIIYVLIDDSKVISVDSESYAARMRQTPTFTKFKTDFEDFTGDFKKNIKETISSGKPIETKPLIDPIYAMISGGSNLQEVFGMIHSLRSYDDATYVHCINVAMICNILGQWLKMSPDEIIILTEAGILHDIGKMEIPEDILNKPNKLTDEEYQLIQTHPQRGYEILKNQQINEHVKLACLQHHERCDGTGYPSNLRGEQIDKFARIVAIADVYDAMTSARVYREALCPFVAIQMFEDEGLQKYDVEAIMTFLKNIVETYRQNRVRLNNGEEGEIIYIDPLHLARPTIQCGDTYHDLSKEKSLYIEAIL